MSSPEIPTQPDQSPLETLFRRAKEAISRDKGERGELGAEAVEALVAWQEAAEKEADIQNTSAANTEVMVSRALLFVEANRPDLALVDLEDALMAAENDASFPNERLEELKDIKRRLVVG